MSPILNTDGKDIRAALERAATEAGIPLQLILAGAIAESGLNPRAERWGRRTREAKEAMAIEDNDALAAIIEDTFPDISFGYSQRIVLYHYAGDRTATVANCLAVRDYVFANPGQDIAEMAKMLAGCLDTAGGQDLSRIADNDLLGALIVYNAGHYPYDTEEWWWARWGGNVESYRVALEQAKEMIG